MFSQGPTELPMEHTATELSADWRPSEVVKREPLITSHGPSPNESQATLLRPPTPEGSEGDDIERVPPTAKWHSQALSYVLNYHAQTWSMYCFLIAGIAVAVGHHLFYNNLDGKEAVNQSTTLRCGTVLAFLAKANFGAAIALAFRQRAWMTVRHKILSLGAVDSLFASINDVSALFSWEAFKRAKLAMFLAIYLWATPLVVILTTDTLSVIPRTKQEHGRCQSIRTINFSNEETSNFRNQTPGSLTIGIWNTTERPEEVHSGDFDYWTAIGNQYKFLADKASYFQQAITRKDVGKEICGMSWNCSYVVEFIGPGYKCEELAAGRRSKVKNLGSSEAPFATDSILPDGLYSYIAVTDQGDYSQQQMRRTTVGGAPLQNRPYPKNLGAFRTEPILWIGYTSLNDPMKTPPRNDTEEGWYDAFTPTIFGCEHYEIRYTVGFNNTSGVQTHEVKRRQFLRKIIDTTYLPGEVADDGTWDNTTAVPESNYIFPTDTRKYRRIAAYHSIGKTFRDLLNGTITMPYFITDTELLKTRLLQDINRQRWPVKNFQTEMQSFYEEIMLSLLSDPRFLAVSWAHDASQYTGGKLGGAETKYPCLRQRPTVFYTYNWMQLCLVYAVVVVVAIVGLLFGVRATQEEGVMLDMRVSSIIAATRAQSLNAVRLDSDEDIKSLKIGFGWVLERFGARTRGFGLEGDVTQEHSNMRGGCHSDTELGRYSGVERETGD